MATGILHVVASPIGNLSDLSARAAQTLAQVDVVFAEDTRRTRELLSHLQIQKPLRSMYEHNEQQRIAEVVGLLNSGQSAALVTDAGTPAVSDPGARLVRAVAQAGLAVTPCVGPSALTAILSVAGFAATASGVLFLEFLPAKGRERAEALTRVTKHRGTVVLFEAPHRLKETIEDLAHDNTSRDIVVGRELTKVHEEILRGTVSELAEWARGEIRGELTLALGPVAEPEADQKADVAEIEVALRRCLGAGLSARDAASAVAVILSRPRREVYTLCQKIVAAAHG